jgi:uncharacterized protein involved in exopolysaccharide biosynthesis
MSDTADTSSVESKLSLLDLALTIAQHIRALVLLPLAAAVIAFGMTFVVRPTYTAVTRVLPPSSQPNSLGVLFASQLGAFSGGVGQALGIKNPADIYVGMLKSRTVSDRLVADFKLRDLYDEKYGEDASRELSKRTTITVSKEGLITLQVEDQDPRRAADLANAYVSALQALTQTLAVTEAAQRRLFFQKQLEQAKEDLAKSETELRRSGVSEAALKTVPQSTLEGLARLKAQITAQEVKLAAMRGFMTESNPQYKQAQQELSALRNELAKSEQTDSSKARTLGAEYIAAFRDFKYYETLFDLMARQYEIARLDEAREGAIIQVVDRAVAPERRSKPRRGTISALSALATLVLVVIAIALMRQFRYLVKDPISADKVSRLKRLLLRP